MNELEFKIYLSDLTPEAQERLLAFMKVKSATELNWDNDTLPIASVPAPDEEFEADCTSTQVYSFAKLFDGKDPHCS